MPSFSLLKHFQEENGKQELFRKGFQRNDVLMWSAVAACGLWIANAAMNTVAGSYKAVAINVLYIICTMTLCAADFKKENNVAQGIIGALMAVFIIGNLNVLLPALKSTSETGVASRSSWQLIVSFILAVALFINHFLISNSKYQNARRIWVNQIIVILILLLRVLQILLNLFGAEHTLLSARSTVGVLAIIPTLNVIVCIESREKGYQTCL